MSLATDVKPTRKFSPRKLVALRSTKGWSPVRLADEMGVHPNTVKNWEEGSNDPTLDAFLKLVDVLGCMEAELVDRVT